MFQVRVTSPNSTEAAAASELLAAIAQLTRLRHLSLNQVNLPAIEGEYNYNAGHPFTVSDLLSSSGPVYAHLQPFSALTASDQLERLELVFRDDGAVPADKRQPVPLGSIQYMLPPGRKLLGLTELVLDAFGPAQDAWEGFGDDGEEYDFSEHWDCTPDDDIDTTESSACLTDGDVEAIAASCPNLKRVTLNGVVESDVYSDDVAKSFRAMQHLPQLTHLCLGGPWLTNNTAAVVAGMTGLHSLQLHNAPALMANGLQRLTALQQLRELLLDFVGRGRDVNFRFEAHAEVRAGSSWVVCCIACCS